MVNVDRAHACNHQKIWTDANAFKMTTENVNLERTAITLCYTVIYEH